jgi:hypothetical protein
MEQRTRKRSNKEITKKTYTTIADKVSMGMENGLRVQTDNKKTDNRTMNRRTITDQGRRSCDTINKDI